MKLLICFTYRRAQRVPVQCALLKFCDGVFCRAEEEDTAYDENPKIVDFFCLPLSHGPCYASKFV